LARRRILIVDAHPLVRRGLVALIDAQPDLVVCAQAATRREAIDAIAAARPDLAIVDLSLRGAPGLLRQACANGIGPPVLVLTVHETPLHVRRAFAAGAVGYVTKRAGTGTLLLAIRSVLRGESFVSPGLGVRSTWPGLDG
jgi:DNA-binding NarL/FixJ family response regulator